MSDISLNELHRRLGKISELGYVRSHRSNDTGVGKTLEDLLGKKEDNASEEDISDFELKAHRQGSSSSITFGTREPDEDKREIWGDAFAKEYGYEDKKGRRAVRTNLQIDSVHDRTGLYLTFDDRTLEIHHEEDGCIAYYTEEDLREWVEKTSKGLIFVTAESKTVEDTEYFQYKSADLYRGLEFDTLERLIKREEMTFELRTRVGKNNGTALRLRQPDDFDKLYDTSESLLDRSGSDFITRPPYDSLDWQYIYPVGEGEISTAQHQLSDFHT